MPSRSIAILAASCILLTACASRQEIAARKAEAERVAQSKREERCASFGYTRGTPDFSHCLENQYVQDQQQAAAERAEDAARAQRIGNSLQQAGAALSSINPPPRQSVVCNTIGTMTTCN